MECVPVIYLIVKTIALTISVRKLSVCCFALEHREGKGSHSFVETTSSKRNTNYGNQVKSQPQREEIQTSKSSNCNTKRRLGELNTHCKVSLCWTQFDQYRSGIDTKANQY